MKTLNRKPNHLLREASSGQALVLLAASFFALLAFIGLVTDVGSIYVSLTQLQRAVDSAAIAAANNIKNPQATYAQRKASITEAAREMLAMHGIDVPVGCTRDDGEDCLRVYLCDDGASRPASFAAMCPSSGQPPRKLAYIEATQMSPVYFLQIFGLRSVPLYASAVSQAAAVDLVLVFDTSESMGITTSGYNPNNFNPSTCNTANSCQPLRTAKDAAKSLIGNLFDGYDQVAIVTFDYDAQRVFNLSSDIPTALAAVDSTILLHDDPPSAKQRFYTLPYWWSGPPILNPINPEDRDGDGDDRDDGLPCTDEYVNIASNAVDVSNNVPDLFDDSTGAPCDDDNWLDTYDWNGNGVWGNVPGNETDNVDQVGGTFEDTSLVSTCSGCGIRVATDTLIEGGRQDSVWVIVFLSDGVANLSDTHTTFDEIPASFRYGFCGNNLSRAFWRSFCIDFNGNYTAPDGTTRNSVGRYCVDDDVTECPPDTTATTTSGLYSVEDYAFDMVDRAALLFPNVGTDGTENTAGNEPNGENIIIYAIGMGAASNGESLLRYMANVGDEGSRDNDPCEGIAAQTNCGFYYYAPSASYLQQIFENIASHVFTKLSR